MNLFKQRHFRLMAISETDNIYDEGHDMGNEEEGVINRRAK